MTNFPGAPKLNKGALITLDPFSALSAVTVFQYNPNTLNRSLQANLAEADTGSGQLPRYTGAPTETITLEAIFDATDMMEKGGGSDGIYPQLAALEVLLYPKSVSVIANQVMLQMGFMEVLPPTVPLTLFVWGIKRVVPVRLTDYSVTEEQHDPQLNPLKAKVSLSLQVLSYNDLAPTNPGWAIFLSHQIVKEVMSTVARVNDTANVLGGNTSIL